MADVRTRSLAVVMMGMLVVGCPDEPVDVH